MKAQIVAVEVLEFPRGCNTALRVYIPSEEIYLDERGDASHRVRKEWGGVRHEHDAVRDIEVPDELVERAKNHMALQEAFKRDVGAYCKTVCEGVLEEFKETQYKRSREVSASIRDLMAAHPDVRLWSAAELAEALGLGPIEVTRVLQHKDGDFRESRVMGCLGTPLYALWIRPVTWRERFAGWFSLRGF